MGDAFQDRLRAHAKSFEGLMSLIPAKLYYGNGDDPSEQWRRKKQTKEERRAARRANLDPDNELNQSAKDVLESRAARTKRKHEETANTQSARKKGKSDKDTSSDEDEEEEEEEEPVVEQKEQNNQAGSDADDAGMDGVVKEQPGDGMRKAKSGKPATKTADDAADTAAGADDDHDADDIGIPLADANLSQKQQKKLLKKQAKAEKRAEKRKQKAEKKQDQDDGAAEAPADKAAVTTDGDDQRAKKDRKEKKEKKEKKDKGAQKESAIPDAAEENQDDDEGEGAGADEDDSESHDGLQTGIGFASLAVEEEAPSVPSSPEQSDMFDTALPLSENKEAASTTTSVSSMSATAAAPVDKNKDAAVGATTTATAAGTETTPSPASRSKVTVPTDTAALRARLTARIEALRAARKADVDELDSSGNVIRTRQQLIEARRQKQAERKLHKKELRKAARLEEERQREAAVASARGSPLVRIGGSDDGAEADGAAGTPVALPTSFSFGRVAFSDGAELSRDLTFAKTAGAATAGAGATKKGPAASDVKGQLARLEAQKRRLAKMDDAQRRDVEDKERWLAARKRAEGVGRGDGGGLTAAAAAAGAIVSGEKKSGGAAAAAGDDDTIDRTSVGATEHMLRKAIKRKEKAKKKSEREWSERKTGVQKAIQDRQKKREDNIRKRREDKMLQRAGMAKKLKKIKKQAAASGGGGGGRPGFEGSFGGRRK